MTIGYRVSAGAVTPDNVPEQRAGHYHVIAAGGGEQYACAFDDEMTLDEAKAFAADLTRGDAVSRPRGWWKLAPDYEGELEQSGGLGGVVSIPNPVWERIWITNCDHPVDQPNCVFDMIFDDCDFLGWTPFWTAAEAQ